MRKFKLKISDLQKLISFILTLIFLIFASFYIKNNHIYTDVSVNIECSTNNYSYIEDHYKDIKTDLVKRYTLNKSEGYKTILFNIDIQNYKDLYFFLGENGQKVNIKKITVRSLLNSFSLSGRRLFNLIEKNESNKKNIIKKGQIIEINTPFTMVSQELNKMIRRLAEEKLIYYLLLIPVSLFIFFFLSFLKFPNISFQKRGDLLSILFVLLLFTPVINNFFQTSSINKQLAEKKIIRKGTDFRFSDPFGSVNRFIEVYKKKFFYRADIIYLNNLFKTGIFKVSPTKKVVLGKEKWLFYALENEECNIIDYYRAVKPFTIEELVHWQKRLEERYWWLKKKGIEYLFIVVPNKSSIYSEYLPDYIKKSRNINRFDQLIEHLKKVKSPIKILDMRKFFLSMKIKYKLYRTSDSHWSHYGAYFAHRLIMNSLKTKDKKPISTLFNDVNIKKIKKYLGGDLAQMLSLENLYREDISILEPVGSNEFTTKQLRDFKRPFVEISLNESKNGKGKMIFVHDSFGYRIIPFMSSYFKRVIFIRDWKLEFYSEMIKKEKPQIVIEEMAERFFMNRRLSNPKELKLADRK